MRCCPNKIEYRVYVALCESGGPASATDIADRLGLSLPATIGALKTLKNAGRVVSFRTGGNRSSLWAPRGICRVPSGGGSDEDAD